MAKTTIGKISKEMQKGSYEALTLINIKEQVIGKFIRNFVDDFESEQIFLFIKNELDPVSQAVLSLYRENPPEWWINIIALCRGEPTLPEVKKLNELKRNLRNVWNRRPRFEQKRILDRHGRK